MRLTYKILWLDDQISSFIEDDYVNEIKNYIEEEGFEPNIDAVGYVKDFVEKLSNSDYDLILTDYHMSDMNGDEVVKMVRKMSVLTEILFYTAQANLTNFDHLDRISFLQTSSNHHEQVSKKIKDLISLTVRKFHDIVIMRGMIMHETSTLDSVILEFIKKYVENNEEESNEIKNYILDDLCTNFNSKLEKFSDWRGKPSGFKSLIKDNFVFSSDYKIKTLSNICTRMDLSDFSDDYRSEIINIRNMFAHAVLVEKDGVKFFVKSGDELIIDYEYCKTVRKNILKHKNNLSTLEGGVV